MRWTAAVKWMAENLNNKWTQSEQQQHFTLSPVSHRPLFPLLLIRTRQESFLDGRGVCCMLWESIRAREAKLHSQLRADGSKHLRDNLYLMLAAHLTKKMHRLVPLWPFCTLGICLGRPNKEGAVIKCLEPFFLGECVEVAGCPSKSVVGETLLLFEPPLFLRQQSGKDWLVVKPSSCGVNWPLWPEVTLTSCVTLHLEAEKLKLF